AHQPRTGPDEPERQQECEQQEKSRPPPLIRMRIDDVVNDVSGEWHGRRCYARGRLSQSDGTGIWVRKPSLGRTQGRSRTTSTASPRGRPQAKVCSPQISRSRCCCRRKNTCSTTPSAASSRRTARTPARGR